MILHSRTVKKLEGNENKKNFKVQPLKLLWIWIFGAVTKVRAMEENCCLCRHSETYAKLVMKLFEAPSWFCWTREEAILTPGLLWWMVEQPVFVASYLWFIFFTDIGWTGCSYLSMSGFAMMKKQYLSSFVTDRGISASCTFMRFLINFQTNSCGFLFVSFFLDEIAFSSILRIKTIFFGRHSILREKKSHLASNFELTRTLTTYEEHGIMAHIPWWLSQSKR